MNVDFLRGFMELNKNTEIPQVFSLWSAISGISCALGRRVYVDMGRFQVYPNVYVILVAGSGRMRKSTAVHQIERFVHQLEPKPNLISQKITPQAFIEALASGGGVQQGGVFVESATGFGFFSEMATFLDRSAYDAGLAPILIDFFDAPDVWEYRTKGRGIENLRNVCFGFLAGSTVDWIRKGIPEEAVGGGLTSRIMFVYAEFNDEMKPVPWTVFTSEERELMEHLVRKMQRMGTYSGQAVVTDPARKFYEESYNDWYTKSGVRFYEDAQLSGYASRRYIHMWKLGLIFAAASESVDSAGHLVIDTQHLRGAIRALEQCECCAHQVMSQILMSEKGSELSNVLAFIARGRGAGISRTDVMRQFSHRMNSRELSEVIETLVHAGKIKILSDGSRIIYQST